MPRPSNNAPQRRAPGRCLDRIVVAEAPGDSNDVLGPSCSRRAFLALSISGVLTACGSQDGGDANSLVWGTEGLRDGDFLRPRAICSHENRVYVIDTTGRAQVFTEAGVFLNLWRTPDASNGTPTAIGVGRDGRLLVPDTHYHRILEYSTDGELLEQWGEYGDGPGQFIYPTGIAQHRDGRYFVCEYGENAERVHVFDGERKFVLQWGSHGFGAGEFNRAMAIALDDELLHVADTTNHRIQSFTLEGELVRVIGGAGSAPGQLRFPFDIALAAGGAIATVEYGNNRVSLFSRDGQCIGVFGTPGRLAGRFNEPRGIAVSPANDVFVADTYNHRIQRFSLEVLS